MQVDILRYFVGEVRFMQVCATPKERHRSLCNLHVGTCTILWIAQCRQIVHAASLSTIGIPPHEVTLPFKSLHTKSRDPKKLFQQKSLEPRLIEQLTELPRAPKISNSNRNQWGWKERWHSSSCWTASPRGIVTIHCCICEWKVLRGWGISANCRLIWGSLCPVIDNHQSSALGCNASAGFSQILNPCDHWFYTFYTIYA